ncbi:cytochrome-c peroxidase [Sinomicrobium weinanense]|uniref:Methylamine utilization protein n=1 Tax=Sinomicrobium weinanense TaxID=2842200 RepID=A0A926JQL9_9FLAO|nr:cytochrome c peroxidase [Sinomicrobium weinanense]MBC9795456.1 methylamine utilization protein [Sinomicrobium weinanense]MBU3123981.1 methylamine utilization protein [Sinomicrobium weinanense]
MDQLFCKWIKGAYFLSLFLFLSGGCKKEAGTAVTDYETELKKQYAQGIDKTIEAVKMLRDTSDTEQLRASFKQARYAFKSIEPLVSFLKKTTYSALNQPNLPEVEEGDNASKAIPPMGFQVIEEVLFQEHPDLGEVYRQADNMVNTLVLEKNNTALQNIKDHHFLWMFREALIRVASLGITGFDSPVIGNSMPENAAVLYGLKEYLHIYKNRFSDPGIYEEWEKQLTASAQMLENAHSFDDFDRYTFIREHIHSAIRLWKETVRDWGVTFPMSTKLNNNANTLFSAETFNVVQFGPVYGKEITEDMIRLGEALFYDKSLSKDNRMNCATCHQPEKAFTDGLMRSMGNKGKPVQRNAPTLLYSGLQAAQFYDARVANLEGQITDVVTNEDEFHSDLKNLLDYVETNETYKQQFKAVYKGGINHKTVRNALASYVRSLSPFNSRFDRNISGVENNLTANEVNGFNLFMGKAKCATCHFAPVFNGTVPPYFAKSELEVLGVPAAVKWKNAKIDEDTGRYQVYGAALKKYAFKTPTVRNAAKTAPYMHNGVYTTLEEVMEFYDKGGGAGIGITLENQTLPPDSLGLTDKEKEDVIAFINTLTDTY